MAVIMVLNDGETFTTLEGCMIVDVPNKVIDSDGVKEFINDFPERIITAFTTIK